MNFRDPGSQASQVLAHVRQLGAAQGTEFSPAIMQAVAMRTMEYGWSDAQIQIQLGSLVTVSPTRVGGVTSNDPMLLATLTGVAGDYLINPNNVTLNQWAKQIGAGVASLESFKAYAAQQAAHQYPSVANQIAAGQTMNQIVDPLRQDIGKLMEVNPAQINFISDPMYSKILNYRPPDVGGKVQSNRFMTTSEAETYLRGTDQYSYTQGARDLAAGQEKALLTTFGKIA